MIAVNSIVAIEVRTNQLFLLYHKNILSSSSTGKDPKKRYRKSAEQHSEKEAHPG